jgi:hypothetical protein
MNKLVISLLSISVLIFGCKMTDIEQVKSLVPVKKDPYSEWAQVIDKKRDTILDATVRFDVMFPEIPEHQLNLVSKSPFYGKVSDSLECVYKENNEYQKLDVTKIGAITIMKSLVSTNQRYGANNERNKGLISIETSFRRSKDMPDGTRCTFNSALITENIAPTLTKQTQELYDKLLAKEKAEQETYYKVYPQMREVHAKTEELARIKLCYESYEVEREVGVAKYKAIRKSLWDVNVQPDYVEDSIKDWINEITPKKVDDKGFYYREELSKKEKEFCKTI